MSVTTMPPGTQDQAPASPQGGRAKKLAIVGLAVLLLGGGGWYQFLRPQPEKEPVPGEVVALESIQLNLAGGHYLRIGIALQLEEGAHEVDGSKALDATIETFSGLSIADVASPKDRRHKKEELEKVLEKEYHGDVMGVYFTEFVTQ